MVHRLLVAFVALAVMAVALGGIEPMLAPPSALMQGLQACAQEHRGGIEDHHLDDVPGQAHADGNKADSLACCKGMSVRPLSLHRLDWRTSSLPSAADSPFLEGLLRPPRASA